MSSISLQGVSRIANNVKEITTGGALVFEDMNVKLDTEVIDILKGFVILGTEVSNTLSSTDSEDTKAKNTMPKEKKKLKDHKFKTQVDSHFRVLFPSINLSVSSSDVNDLHKNPEKNVHSFLL